MGNLNQLIQQANELKNKFGNQNPQDVLNQLIKSGQVSEEQVNQAVNIVKNMVGK